MSHGKSITYIDLNYSMADRGWRLKKQCSMYLFLLPQPVLYGLLVVDVRFGQIFMAYRLLVDLGLKHNKETKDYKSLNIIVKRN